MSSEDPVPLLPEAEQQLMQQLVAGDEEAIRRLYARFGRTVYTLGLRLLGSSEAAEELTQDVFVAAWRKGSRFDPSRGRLSTWLMAIAHNLAIDRLRHERGGRRPALVSMSEVPEPAPNEHEDELVDRETARGTLECLSPRERQLVRLAYFEGWTAREIADAGGIPLGTVKTRIRTALIKVRRAEERKAQLAAEMQQEGVS